MNLKNADLEIGKNINNAFKVALETYENLDKFFSELDRQSEKEGYLSISPRFLRWRSDQHIDGWLYRSFIKLFQDINNKTIDDDIPLRIGPIYALEVNFNFSESNVPLVYLSKFIYENNFCSLKRLPSVSEHYMFYWPIRHETDFNFTKNNDEFNISKPINQIKKKDYWGLEEVVFTSVGLVNIDSPDKIKEIIFGTFNKL